MRACIATGGDSWWARITPTVTKRLRIARPTIGGGGGQSRRGCRPCERLESCLGRHQQGADEGQPVGGEGAHGQAGGGSLAEQGEGQGRKSKAAGGVLP